MWSAAYRGETEIGGFSLDQTLTYFVTLLVLQFFIGAFSEDYEISEEIRSGLINQFLTKPINYFVYRFTIFVSARLVSGLLALVPLTLALPLIGDYLTFPDEVWRLVLGLPAAFMLTFWFLEIQSFVILSMTIETLLGGQVFPLDLLPDTIYRISQFLPYYYQMYFPAAILTGRIDYSSASQGLLIQAFWVVALLVIAQVLWRRGLHQHTAVGG